MTKQSIISLKNGLPRRLSSARNDGFTLAEVLITLVIIGVVAALTVPNLIIKHQKEETVARLKKAYSTLSNAWQHSHFDLGTPEENLIEIGPESYFTKYWKPYIDVMKYCQVYSDCGYSSIAPFYKPNGDADTVNVVNSFGFAFFAKDGTFFAIRVAETTATNPSGTIIVDLNGPKKPNKYGHDVFFFTRIENNNVGIKPQGYNETLASINNNCTKTGSGNSHKCAAKIMKDGWQIKDDYPW